MTDPRGWPPPLDEARAAQIRTVVMTEIAREAPRRRRRTVTVLAAAAAVLLAGVGTATALLRFADPDVPNEGYCSPSAVVDRAVWEHYGFSPVLAPDGSIEPFAAIETCAAMWQAGIVTSPDVTGVPDELTACIVEGALVVMPGDARVCERLGVPAARPTSTSSSG